MMIVGALQNNDEAEIVVRVDEEDLWLWGAFTSVSDRLWTEFGLSLDVDLARVVLVFGEPSTDAPAAAAQATES